MADVKDILKKYDAKFRSQLGSPDVQNINYSKAYVTFKEEMAPAFNKYERWCKSLGSIIKLKISNKDKEKIEKDLEYAHLDVEPWQALTLAVMAFAAVFFIGLIVFVSFLLIFNQMLILFFALVLVFALFLFYYMKGYPRRFANKWRLKASSQMVPAILYVVVYMRHTANLEKAIAFAANHLEFPLALDFKKIFYDVQVGKFSTIKESLDNYLETWRDYSPEFIESFHLVESSLFEPDNTRRIQTLEKALKVALDGVHDRMLKFTHDVRSPLFNVYALGIMLPTLALALLPLAAALLGGMIQWTHVFILFNLIVPFAVFYMTNKIMMQRPGGYGETKLLEKNPLYPKYKSRAPYYVAFFICLPLFLLGLIPFIFQYTPIPEALGLQTDYTFAELGMSFLGDGKFFYFLEKGDGYVGPFGIGALILSLFIPLSIALFFSLASRDRTAKLIVERNKTRQLEKEFNSSLFQLGNRIGNGVPPELVFGKVAQSTKGLKTSEFFSKVDYNIKRNGMSVEKAIFDPRRGALIYFPSDLIATSMRILIESAKKGLKIAAVSLMGISEYVKNINKITTRLKDMLAEVASEMKSNMTFLAPLLAGIIVGLEVMIVAILSKLNLNETGEVPGFGALGNIVSIFELPSMIPPYFLQVSIGIYIIQIIFILTGTLVTINSGEDKLEKTNKTGKNLMKGMMLYFLVSLIATLILSILATVVLGNL